MKKLLLIIMATFATSCSTLERAPSDKMLNTRAAYDNAAPLDVSFRPSKDKMLPQRASAVLADIWIHPGELGHGEYFMGGWMRAVIKQPHWAQSGELGEAFRPKTIPDVDPDEVAKPAVSKGK